MTRDEMKELACLGFSSDLVMQSFCHTAAYPKPVDLQTQQDLPDFFAQRGGVALRPGDGIIHSWLNRMLLPDTVGTGGDSHTRFPLGISFPAGSGLVAFAAAIGAMPLDMPESVLVRFSGALQPGVTLRDVVNAIPWVAIQRGLLTVEKANKKNIFNGRIMEIEGLPDLKLEQAFELTDATAERSCAGCTIKLSEATVSEYLRSNVALLKNMIARGYSDARTLARRVKAMEDWLANPQLLQADPDAEYAEILEINLDELTEPGSGLSQRSRQCEAAERSGWKCRSGGLHWFMHDQHRPLPRRRKSAGRFRQQQSPALGLSTHKDGRRDAEARGVLRHLRSSW
jgi:aconitate hydratase 2/2-methylisocitrate dehydratase